MSILNNRVEVKNTEVEDSVYMDLDLKVTQGSIPNRLLSLALSAGAAYAVGISPWYIAVTILVSVYMFLLPGTSRLLFEAGVAGNMLVVALATIPPEAVTALEYLIVFKLLLELVCLAFDRLTQFYAALTADQNHSYYLFLTLFVFLTKVAVVYATPSINGVIAGFQAGISGM